MAGSTEGGSFTYQLIRLPDDVVSMSLSYLPLENQISLRRVCTRFQAINDQWLSRLQRIHKKEMQSLPFEGREWLVKCEKLTNLQTITLISVELDENLAKHLARFSPHLRTIVMDGTCYNRCLEFVREYLTAFRLLHPNEVPQLQVSNLIEDEEKVRCLLNKFPNWDVSLSLLLSNIWNWSEHLHHINTIVVAKNTGSLFESFPKRMLSQMLTNLRTIIFSGVTLEDCFSVRDLLEMVQVVIFEDHNVEDYGVILALEGIQLKNLQMNLNHHKDKTIRTLFLQTLTGYLKSCGRGLKYIKVTTSHLDDSTELVCTLIDLQLTNIQFDIGNPSEKFYFLHNKLGIKHWSGTLVHLLHTFPKAQQISIVTDSRFNVFEWISEIKAFTSGHLNRVIVISIIVEGHQKSIPSITITGNNYTLNIPKIVGLNYDLNPNNVLFAFNLAETSQITDLRNKALSFMKEFLGDRVPRDCCSTREICNLFKSLPK